MDLLISEISEAAHEAIEQAAGEAAKAAFLISVEREAAAYREAAFQQSEALRWRLEAENNLLAIKAAKKKGIKNTVFGVVIGIFSGLAVGTLIIGGK